MTCDSLKANNLSISLVKAKNWPFYLSYIDFEIKTLYIIYFKYNSYRLYCDLINNDFFLFFCHYCIFLKKNNSVLIFFQFGIYLFSMLNQIKLFNFISWLQLLQRLISFLLRRLLVKFHSYKRHLLGNHHLHHPIMLSFL